MGFFYSAHLIASMVRAGRGNEQLVARLRDRRLRRLLCHAVARSRFYRELYDGIDVETCRLTDLPVVTKPAMMARYDDFVTDPRLERAGLRKWLSEPSNLGQMYLGQFIPFQTSGTTGENAIVVYDRKAMAHVHAALIARRARRDQMGPSSAARQGGSRRWRGKVRSATVVMAGGPYPAYTTASHMPRWHDLFIDHRIFSLTDPIDRIVAGLNDHQPETLLSYPSLLEVLAREQLAGRLRLSFESPRATLSTASEPLSPTTRELARRAWGMEIHDTYGSSECMVMARSCGSFDRMHVMTDLCILEVVDGQHRPVPDGQVGEKILVTNLFNLVQPFIRYEVSDVTGYSTEPCDCGWPFPRLLRVEGRTDDIFYVDRPDGSGFEAIHPYLLLGPIVQLDEIREYQVIQTARNEVTLSYVPEAPSADLEAKIGAVLGRGLEAAGLADRITLHLSRVDHIPRDAPSGKYRQIISRVGPPPELDRGEMSE